MEIRRISWEQTIPLRHRVLWPMKPPEYCYVEGDDDAWHFGAFVDNELVCVASVFLQLNKARLRKFATNADYQSQGIGSQMLRYILQALENTDAKVFWCDARESALNFYQRFGMQPYGKRFYKADVSYVKMQVTL
ncbi:GNAT family N-acetyltransferase [Thalassotalea atypica]|uniref:GNAT family N-acetyltransferase n=1 Tax=Thalassotalea atypica TaxID=2054316 RepID=UPI0025730336|nr:GNAT family N-acetyltransferase [Thalassotalea atypica]